MCFYFFLCICNLGFLEVMGIYEKVVFEKFQSLDSNFESRILLFDEMSKSLYGFYLFFLFQSIFLHKYLSMVFQQKV